MKDMIRPPNWTTAPAGESSVIFEEILRAVDELNEEERRLLRQYIDQRPEKPARLTPIRTDAATQCSL